LKPDGVYVCTDGLENVLVWVGMRLLGRKRLRFASGRRTKDDVELLKQLVEAGEYRPVIDRTYPMAEVVEAHRYVEAWHKAGNVVLTIP
jgi:NADPH:quinone reductase-like Zn-dependent oxidoreductase